MQIKEVENSYIKKGWEIYEIKKCADCGKGY